MNYWSAPYQNYLLRAVTDDLVSNTLTGLVVFPNKPLDDRDFRLRKPTRVHGRLLSKRGAKTDFQMSG